MERTIAAAALAAILAGAAPSQRELTIERIFELERTLTPVYDEPLGWLDEEHFSVFADAGPGHPGVKTFFRENARTGERETLLDPRYRDAFARLPGVRGERLAEALDDADAFRWNAAHDGFVVNFANDLFHYDLPSGRARRLTHSSGAEVGERVSPDGRLVGFVHESDLWVVPVDGGTPLPLTDGGDEELFFGRLDWVYQEELYGRGNFQGYWWSPDSTRIALLRLDESPVEEFTLVADVPTRPDTEVTNYPKAGDPNPVVDLGVVDVAGGEVRWFDLTRYGTQDTLIVRVTWHPSGAEVFFQVQDREQTWLEMLAGDAASGDTRLVFREESPCWVESGPEPIWLADGAEFLWRSERDGFQHVYRYGRGGSELGRVTAGEWEVDDVVAVDESSGRIWFVSDLGDWKQHHLWEIRLDGTGLRRITDRDGWHDVSVSPGRGLFVDRYSNILHRLTVAVHEAADGARLRTIVRSDDDALREHGVEPPEFVQVETRDGFAMEAMMFKPRGFAEGTRYPVVCHVYAGPHAPRVLNRWRRRDVLFHAYLAQRGFLVWVCDNRSASGKGRVSAQACYRKMGQQEVLDHEDGVRWLCERGLADPERIGIWGWSYGGYQTLYDLTHSELWCCGVAVNPVTDWRLYDTIYTERYMGLPQTNAEGYRKGSVLEAAAELRGELLLVHATMDDNVHMQNSLQLVHALQKVGKQFRFMVYPRVRHGIADQDQQVHLLTMMAEYFEEQLR